MKDVNVILGERIKLARLANKLTREKLAEAIDVSPRFLAEVEAGKVGVSLQTLKNISVALTVTSDYLLGLDKVNQLSSIDAINLHLLNVNEKYHSLIFNIVTELEKM